jgi:hypothetical protein
MTTQKVTFNGYLTQIRFYSTNEVMTRYYGKLFEAAFKILDANQELELLKIKLHKEKQRRFNNQVTKQIFSTKELANFFRLPDRRMQLDYKDNLKAIEVTENILPKELQNGQIPIGTASYKGHPIVSYWNTKDYAMATMHKVLVGLQRTGKTTYIKRFAIEAMKAGHSVFILDTIKMCETANDVRDFLPVEFHDKIVVLDYGNLDYKFKNILSFPIFIEGIISGNSVIFNVYSDRSLSSRTYDLVSETTDTIQPNIKYIDDPNMYEGETKIEQPSSIGYKVKVYKKIYENGKLVGQETVSSETYNKVDGVIRRGTKKKEQ